MRRRPVGGRLGPDRVDEAVDGDDLPGLGDQCREDAPLLGPAERDDLPVASNLDGAEHAELEAHRLPSPPSRNHPSLERTRLQFVDNAPVVDGLQTAPTIFTARDR